MVTSTAHIMQRKASITPRYFLKLFFSKAKLIFLNGFFYHHSNINLFGAFSTRIQSERRPNQIWGEQVMSKVFCLQ